MPGATLDVDHAEGVLDVEPALLEHGELVVERHVHGDPSFGASFSAP